MAAQGPSPHTTSAAAPSSPYPAPLAPPLPRRQPRPRQGCPRPLAAAQLRARCCRVAQPAGPPSLGAASGRAHARSRARSGAATPRQRPPGTPPPRPRGPEPRGAGAPPARGICCAGTTRRLAAPRNRPGSYGARHPPDARSQRGAMGPNPSPPQAPRYPSRASSQLHSSRPGVTQFRHFGAAATPRASHKQRCCAPGWSSRPAADSSSVSAPQLDWRPQ
mmetsp:Transcript_23972/g.81775  ORF Transcript_23972/g.81775 Transcript_23972/m.81775 type:complete len:220 (+) Transcript_23972:2173-2832(+)